MLINKLIFHVLGRIDPGVRKAVPDLSATEITGQSSQLVDAMGPVASYVAPLATPCVDVTELTKSLDDKAEQPVPSQCYLIATARTHHRPCVLRLE
jgi:hypothetical protein